MTYLLIAAGIVAGLLGIGYLGEVLWKRYGQTELNAILTDVEGLKVRLETFVADKGQEIAGHLEEIALHNSHLQLKGKELDRAKRIVSRLEQLIQ